MIEFGLKRVLAEKKTEQIALELKINSDKRECSFNSNN